MLRLLRGNLSAIQTAHALGISANTLKTHTKHIYRKLGVNDRRTATVRSANLFGRG